TFPSYSDEASLQLAMIDHMPRAAFKQEMRPGSDTLMPPSVVDGTVRSGTDGYAMFFSVLWYGILAVIAFGFVMSSQQAGGLKPAEIALWGFAILFFAIIPFSAFRSAWLRFMRGSVHEDENGIKYADGVRSFGAPWHDIRFIECQMASYR